MKRRLSTYLLALCGGGSKNSAPAHFQSAAPCNSMSHSVSGGGSPPIITPPIEPSLFDSAGRRKYLSASEAGRLTAAAAQAGDERTKLFAAVLLYTGARISEVLEVTPARLDTETCRLVFRTLKHRRLAFRAIPIPRKLMRQLATLAANMSPDERLFPWSRQTAWRRFKALALAGAISGPQATPRGCRHRFGVLAIERSLSEGTLATLLGHTNTRSTRIYTAAVGAEERALVRRMWRSP